MQFTAEMLLNSDQVRERFYKSIPVPFRSQIKFGFDYKIKQIQNEWKKVGSRDKVAELRAAFYAWSKSKIEAVEKYKALQKKIAFDEDALQKKCWILSSELNSIQGEFSAHFAVNENSSCEDGSGAIAAMAQLYRRFRRLTIWGVTDEYYYADKTTEENIISVEPLDLEKYYADREYQSEVLSTLLKALEPEWWFKRYRRAFKRMAEEFAVASGLVGKGQKYCTNHCLTTTALSDYKSQLFLESVEIERDDGFSVSLGEVIKHSLSNPANRHAQLMARIAGLEKLGKHENLLASFYTITAPSRFHRNSEKYDGSSPNEAREHLQKNWTKIRAELKRLGVYHFGVRVAEAHKDGCPHWHMMLWVEPGQQMLLDAVFKHYVLSDHQQELVFDDALLVGLFEPKQEKGVVFRTPRLEIKRMLPEFGHPTGYIIKYISKNIRAHNESKAPEDVTTYADRVNAWARTHRIRQFQFIGDAKVTAWNEARRVSPEIIEKFQLTLTKKTREFIEVCRSNDWFGYVLMTRENVVNVNKEVYRDINSATFSKKTQITGIEVTHKNPIRAAYDRLTEMAEKGLMCVNPEAVAMAKERLKIGVAQVWVNTEFRTRFYEWKRKPPPGRAERGSP